MLGLNKIFSPQVLGFKIYQAPFTLCDFGLSQTLEKRGKILGHQSKMATKDG